MKVRKMVAGLAAVSMLAAFSAQAVMAADTVSISAENVKAKAGAEFTLKVELGDVPATGINALEFALTYDPAIVTVNGVTAGAIADNGVDDVDKLDGAPAFGTVTEKGLVTLTYTTAQYDAAYLITDNGVFATITGTVAANAKVGDSTKVSIVAIDRAVKEGSADKNEEIVAGYIDAEGNATQYTCSLTNGSVTVVGDDDQPTSGGGNDNPGDVTLWGDVNVDNDVTLLDVVLLNKYLMIGETVTDQGKINADVDQNNKLDTNDSLNILKACIDLITLPVE